MDAMEASKNTPLSNYESYFCSQQLSHPLTISCVQQQIQGSDPSDAGGAQSGKSETFNEALLLDPAAAAAAAAVGHAVAEHLLGAAGPCDTAVAGTTEVTCLQAAAPASSCPPPDEQLPELCPLPPPEPSEGPEAAAEYEVYLQRWEAGETLAQRWHRLAQSGKLDDIRGDWEDWQLDVMLEQVKARTQQALSTQPGKGAGGGGHGLICSTRLRRGRGEVEEAADSASEEPRRVRSRRAPSTLQDYHVENAPSKTPEAAAEVVDAAGAAAAAAGTPAQLRSYRQQLLLPPQPAADIASEESTDDAADTVTTNKFMQQQQQQHMQYTQQPQQQQQQQQRPPGRRGPLPQQPPKRVVTRVQRSSAAPQQAAARQFNRVITPYNPQLHQQMAAQQQQQQQQMLAAMQQEQQQMLAGISPEMLEEFYKMGSRLGAAFNAEGDTTAGLAQNPAAMAAFMHTLYQYGANPAAFAQQVSSMMGPQQQ